MGNFLNFPNAREYHFLVDDESSLKYGIRVSTASSQTVPSPKFYDYEDILGRNGQLSSFMETYENKQIIFDCNFANNKGKTPQEWHNQYRKIKNWIMNANDKQKVHTLKQSDDLEWYMNILKVEISECKRTNYEVGSFSITYTVEPFSISVSGNKWYEVDEVKYNPYYLCSPVWRIKNLSSETKNFTIQVNDNKKFTVRSLHQGRNYYVDTDLQLTYFMMDGRDTKYPAGRSGLEEWLMLDSGVNKITCSDGFEVACMPRWRSL